MWLGIEICPALVLKMGHMKGFRVVCGDPNPVAIGRLLLRIRTTEAPDTVCRVTSVLGQIMKLSKSKPVSYIPVLSATKNYANTRII